MAQLLFETGYGIRRSSCSAFWQIFSWAAVNCSSGLTEPWRPTGQEIWRQMLLRQSAISGFARSCF